MRRPSPEIADAGGSRPSSPRRALPHPAESLSRSPRTRSRPQNPLLQALSPPPPRVPHLAPRRRPPRLPGITLTLMLCSASQARHFRFW
jgi:hypothetical protein